MAWINEGLSRSLTITVTKYVGGNVVVGYPKIYNGQNSWGDATYPTLTDIQFKQLTTAEFEARYAAFKTYVESVEPGLDFTTDISGDGATVYSSECVTTTTEAPATAYAFSVKYAQYAVDACDGTSTVVYSDKYSPQIGDTIYKDVNLTQTWDVTNGKYLVFFSPLVRYYEAIEVSTSTGKVLSYSGFKCTDTSSGTLSFSLKWAEVVDSTCTGTGQCGLNAISLSGVIHVFNSLGTKVKSVIVDIAAGATNPHVFTFDGLPLGDTYSVSFGGATMLCDTSQLSATICSRQWSDAGHGISMQTGQVTSYYAPGSYLFGEIKGYVPNI